MVQERSVSATVSATVSAAGGTEVAAAAATLPGTTVEAPAAGTVAAAPGRTVQGTVVPEAPDGLSATDLVSLGRLVGADPRTAAVAAAEVATSGCTSLRLALPMLAAALAEEVALPDGTDASTDTEAAAGPVLSARAGDLVLVVGSPTGSPGGAGRGRRARHLLRRALVRRARGPRRAGRGARRRGGPPAAPDAHPGPP